MLMKQKKMLALTLSQLVLLYRQEFPGLAALADASGDGERFRMGLREFVDAHRAAEGEAAEQIRLLIDYDGRSVRELSTDRQLEVRTLTLLWQFLTGRLENPEMPSDLFVDLYHLFRLLDAPEIPLPSPQRVRSRTERWLSGQDDGVRAIRADNHERMLHLLIQKIENRKSKVPSRFQFADGMTYEEKYRQVAAWWGDFRFQLAMAVKSPSELNRFLAGSLSSETMYLLSKARKKGMPFFATPYYLSLLDVLITGGDALMSQNKTLRNILEAVCRMAGRKRRANARRPDGEKYAELQRVRLGSRLPAYLPMRVNDELVEILREFREKASAVGVKQFIIQTHFQTPLEVTPEAEEAIRKILSAGWLITNQLVYTVAASRRGHTTRLRQVLNSLGVVCYYTFSVKGFQENYAVFTPNSRSMQEQVEEKVYGRLTPEQAAELDDLLADGTDTAAKIRRFMRRHHLPFLATDRSVLNLPAIGKSMSFRLVGITAEGKRLLRFDHDRTRRHSPIIDSMGEIFIVENKSLAAYLRQLGKMGEDPEDYASIWAYTHGETEPRFGLYVYPDFGFATTDRVSNLELE